MKKIFFIISIISSLVGWSQHEPQYSQYMFNQLVLNPAYAGSKDALSSTIFYRQQWAFAGAPRTATVSIHSPLKRKKVGIGFSMVGDKIGPKQNTVGHFTYSYALKLKKSKLAFGLRAGIYHTSFNHWPENTFKDPQENYRLNKTSKTSFTSDAGIYYYSNSQYFGFSITQLFNSRIAASENFNNDAATLSPHFFVTYGKAWAISEKFIFSPSIVIKGAESAPITFDVNLSAMINQQLWIGVGYREYCGLVAYTQYKVAEKWKLGYAVDFATKLSKVKIGPSHEIMIGYDLNIFNSKIFSPRYL